MSPKLTIFPFCVVCVCNELYSAFFLQKNKKNFAKHTLSTPFIEGFLWHKLPGKFCGCKQIVSSYFNGISKSFWFKLFLYKICRYRLWHTKNETLRHTSTVDWTWIKVSQHWMSDKRFLNFDRADYFESYFSNYDDND